MIRPDRRPVAEFDPGELDALGAVLGLIHARTGRDFSGYKKPMLLRRVRRRVATHHLADLAAYLALLHRHPEEASALATELLIGVTRFFRDPPVWQALAEVALPRLIREHAGRAALRAWVPGCATGEEAYSLAILYREVLDQCAPPLRLPLQIQATDLDPVAIETARQGVYRARCVSQVAPERLARGFVLEQGRYRVRPEIRDMVSFAVHNLVMDPPPANLDLVSCRNVLIYLESSHQQRILSSLHASLNPGGVLVLGGSETLGALGERFERLPGKSRIFRKPSAHETRGPSLCLRPH